MNDMTMIMMIPQIHHAHCMQQQHSYHSDIYIHSHRQNIDLRGKVGEGLGVRRRRVSDHLPGQQLHLNTTANMGYFE